MPSPENATPTVSIRPPLPGDRRAFIAAARRSRALHHPWTVAPGDDEAFDAYLRRGEDPRHACYLVVHDDGTPRGALAGVINANEIVRGAFHSAYLGYYAFEGHAGQGRMRAGLSLVLDDLFDRHRLHRVEANIQPANRRSIALVRALGFRLEGFSPRYLHIDGDWRDHARYALRVDDWRGPGPRLA